MSVPSGGMETPLAAEYSSEGARLEEFEGCLLPATFSDFDQEYRAAKESVAIFDTNWLAILSLSGRDRVKYLHAITSNDIKGLGEGYGRLALLLNPQGRIQAELEIYALAESLLVLTHAAFRERTVATLKKFVIGSQVVVEDQTEKMGSLAIEGPRAAAVFSQKTGLALSGFSEFAIAQHEIDGVPCFLVRRSHFGGEGVQIVAPREPLKVLWKDLERSVHALGGRPIGMKALNALRLEANVPRFPSDFNDGMIPHEAVLENTHISFTKGCYTGQEIVERVRSRGHVNRKRVSLQFSSAEPPASGTKLKAGDAEVGFVTSAAYSPQLGSAIGIGYLRREHTEPGSTVHLDGGTATVR